MSDFEKLEAWQNARLLARHIYDKTRLFPRDERFGLTQQIRRASISILSNIAEGKGRSTTGEYKAFLRVARGSTFEVEAQLIIATDLEFLDQSAGEELIERARQIARMINGILRHLEDR